MSYDRPVLQEVASMEESEDYAIVLLLDDVIIADGKRRQLEYQVRSLYLKSQEARYRQAYGMSDEDFDGHD
jgi:hypothetical protein